MRTLLGLCCFAAATLAGGQSALAQQADAAPFHVALEYSTGVAECPNDQQLRQAVQAELGRDPFDDQAGERVTVAIRAQGSRLLAEIGLPQRQREATRVRELASPRGDCRELVRALTLALCLVIDPLHVETSSTPSSASSATELASKPGEQANAPGNSSVRTSPSTSGRQAKPAKSAASAATQDAGAEPSPQPFGQSRAHAYVQLSALASTGLAPGVGFGAALELGARRGPFSVGVAGRYDLARETAFQAGTVSVSSRVLSVVPCWLPAPFAACGLLSGGELLASGGGFPVNHRGKAPIFGAGVRAAYEVPVNRHLALSVFAEAAALLDHAELIANGSVAWQAWPLFADLGVSGVVLF